MVHRIPTDAFEYYASMGPQRSYKLVADHYGVTKRAVTKHATGENWSERLQEIERQARKRTDEKLVVAAVDMRDRHLKTVKAMQARALEAIRQYPLSTGMEAMRAAESAIKLERLIVGEASERTEMNIEEVTRRELERWLVVPEGGTNARDR